MEILKKFFVALLVDIVDASGHTKYISSSNQKRKIQLTLINLHPNGYIQELHHYPFAVNLDKCIGSCNINDFSDKACFPNKTKDLNTHVFNMITRKNELKILTQYAPCKCECKLDGRKSNLNQNWNNYKCWCKSKKHHISIKYHIWNRATCSCENCKYYASIIDDSVIAHDEIIEATNFNKKQGTCKIK